MADANKALEPLYSKFAAMPTEELANNKEAKAIGERLFMNNCSQCHGSDAKGSRGFPNLTDHDWLHGGSPEKIQETITGGRIGMMPPMAAAVGTEDDVKNVANYVLSLSDSKHDAARAALGKEKFAVCAACHGPEGKGSTDIGSPNLTDKIWLHGAGEAAIIKRINEGKVNPMRDNLDRFNMLTLRANYLCSIKFLKNKAVNVQKDSVIADNAFGIFLKTVRHEFRPAVHISCR